MKIVVIGAGSVGMLVASFLAETNHEVTFLVKREAQAEQFRQVGLVRENLDGSFQRVHVHATTDLSEIPKDAVILVAVKYGQLNELYPTLRNLHTEIPLLFLQNGLAHYEEALLLPQHHIFFGSCQFGAQKEQETTVIHRGKGVIKLATGRGDEQLLTLFEEVQNEQFPVEFVEDAEQMLLEKALLNCFVNPMTAILQVKNGELIRRKHTIHLLQALYNELMVAFPNITLSFEDVINLCKRTAPNTSSMLSDRLQHRPTEVETIVGAIIRKAEKNGDQLPTLRTLYHLLSALEESGDKM